MDKDVYYMKQALKLAKSGLGQTSPNPSVGCVIVKNGVVISSARTQKGGRPHAESIAIESSDTDISEATIYITLEPCCTLEHNKTSCLERIIAAKFSRVVIGTTDPNPKINGKSIKALQQNGVEVKVGVLEESCQEIISGFKKRMLTNMPFITLKLAISLDGKIALKNGQSKWITSEKQREAAHELRAQNDAILTGIGTVIADDPLLTCRLPKVDHNAIRVILDTDFKMPEHSQITQTSREVRTIIFTAKEISNPYKALEVITVKRTNDGLCLNDVLRKLAELGINNLLVEAGQKINTSFIRERLVDKLMVFQSNKIIGADGLSAIGELNLLELEKCPQFNTVLIDEK